MKQLTHIIVQETFTNPPNYVKSTFIKNLNSNNNNNNIIYFIGREAGDVYLKAGETEIKSGEADGSARKFLNASTCYKKIDPERKNIVIIIF